MLLFFREESLISSFQSSKHDIDALYKFLIAAVGGIGLIVAEVDADKLFAVFFAGHFKTAGFIARHHILFHMNKVIKRFSFFRRPDAKNTARREKAIFLPFWFITGKLLYPGARGEPFG